MVHTGALVLATAHGAAELVGALGLDPTGVAGMEWVDIMATHIMHGLMVTGITHAMTMLHTTQEEEILIATTLQPEETLQ